MIRYLFTPIALALLLITAARPALAVYTGDINLYLDDRQGKPAKETFITVGQPIDFKLEQNIGENWQRDKDPQINFGDDPYYPLGSPPPTIMRTLLTQIALPSMLLGETAFLAWIAATGGLEFLSFLYALETGDPYCRYYNMVDDYYAGLLTRAEFNRLADGLQDRYGRGPWSTPYLYARDEESSISSLFKPPTYLNGGIVTGYDDKKYDRIRTVTGEDGHSLWPENPVTRGSLFYNQGAYSMRYDIPLHEGKNNYDLSHYKYDRWAVGGGFNVTASYKYDGWKPTSYTKIGTNYELTTGWTVGSSLDYKFGTGTTVEKDFSIDAYITPNDPLYGSSGSWKQSYADQWALKRIGFKPLEDPTSAWNITTGTERPVVVAVLDSGIDLTHPDLNIANIWRNPKETPGNARDDDNNGFIDDLIGWNFVQNNNNPFDLVGHGTHVAGLIAARWNNGRGIAGINRGARIMPLKVLNEIGKGWGSDLARAIVYAVDNGARIINISAGHEGQSKFLEKALAYTQEKNVLVVVAAGNNAIDAKSVEPANQPGALVVAATLPNDKRVGFSNYGEKVHIAAPGVDVLSLRARGTDVVRRVSVDPSKNKPFESVVGKDQEYYRASGTSFAAPLVTGVASLMLAKNPNLTAEQIKRMLMMSADDIEAPGWDLATGYGLLNARKALEADPDYYLFTELHRIAPARDGGRTVIQVFGTAMGSHFTGYRVEIGKGENPSSWKAVGRLAGGQVKESLLATLAPQDFGDTGMWSVRLVAQDRNNQTRESRQTLNLQ